MTLEIVMGLIGFYSTSQTCLSLVLLTFASFSYQALRSKYSSKFNEHCMLGRPFFTNNQAQRLFDFNHLLKEKVVLALIEEINVVTNLP